MTENAQSEHPAGEFRPSTDWGQRRPRATAKRRTALGRRPALAPAESLEFTPTRIRRRPDHGDGSGFRRAPALSDSLPMPAKSIAFDLP